MAQELGGVVKLKGTFVKSSDKLKPFDTTSEFKPGKELFQETGIAENTETIETQDKVEISLVPFYARLNRGSRYFRVWIPATGSGK